MGLYIRSYLYSLQKLGNRPNENEDAAVIVEPPEKTLANGPARGAVADGATTGAFSAEWAKALVVAAVEGWSIGRSLEESADTLRKAWDERFAGLQIPWYAEAKARAGSFATLLSLQLCPPNESATRGIWEARAVGDTCLFHIRDNQLNDAFPLASSDAFDSSPPLIASKTALHGSASEVSCYGDWQKGDRFYVMTDALAAWFLRSHEQQREPWAEITDWITQDPTDERFARWIDDLRTAHDLRNDDVTLLLIEVSDAITTPSAR